MSTKSIKLLNAFVLVGLIIAGNSFAASSEMTQTVTGGGVTAKATYLNPKGSSEDARFRIVLDTHSVNLDAYDLKAIAVLRDVTGQIYAPLAVENKGGGHHREAVVSFPKLSAETKQVELVIRDLAGVRQRIFRWDLD